MLQRPFWKEIDSPWGNRSNTKSFLPVPGKSHLMARVTAPIASILFTHVNITEERKFTLTDKNRARLLSSKTEAKIRLYISYIALVFQNNRWKMKETFISLGKH